MDRELKELCCSAFKNLKHDYFYIDEGDKLATTLQSYMRKKVLKRRIDEQKNHVRNSFASEQKYQKERIEELEQQLKAENHNE